MQNTHTKVPRAVPNHAPARRLSNVETGMKKDFGGDGDVEERCRDRVEEGESGGVSVSVVLPQRCPSSPLSPLFTAPVCPSPLFLSSPPMRRRATETAPAPALHTLPQTVRPTPAPSHAQTHTQQQYQQQLPPPAPPLPTTAATTAAATAALHTWTNRKARPKVMTTRVKYSWE